MPIAQLLLVGFGLGGLAFGAVVLIVLRLRLRSIQPCPQCGKRSTRTLIDHQTGPAGLRPRTLVYQCQSCLGSMSYARESTGREFWKPIDVQGHGPSRLSS